MRSQFWQLGLQIRSALCLAIVTLIATCLSGQVLAGSAPDLFYDISVELADSGKTIEVDLSICYGGLPIDQPALYLFTSQATVKSVELVEDSSAIPLEWTHLPSDSLRIRFNGRESQSMNGCIRIQYELACGEEPYGDIMLRRENRWYPVLPLSPFRYRLEYEAPEIYTVLSSGLETQEDLVDSTRRGLWLQMNPTFTLPLLFLNESVLTTHEIESSKGVTIKYYGYSSVDSTILSILNRCAQSLDYFEEVLCSYPYPILHVVEVRDFPAVQSLAGMLLVGENSIKYYWYEGFGDWPGHEIAHQWIGHTVLTNCLSVGPGRLFVEESFSEYMRISFLRSRFGEAAADSVLGAYREAIRAMADDYSSLPLHDLPRIGNREEGKVVYMYGPLVLRELEKHLGSDKWQTLLRTVMDRYRFKPFTYQDLRETLISTTQDSASAGLVDSLIRGPLDLLQDEPDQ